MDLFSLREKEIFESLKQLKHLDFVVIGGYAVGAYTLPRFSVDCDLVVRSKMDSSKIAVVLRNRGYVLRETSKGGYSSFQRFEKIIGEAIKTSFDILIQEVFDRRTSAHFSADWIFKHCSKKLLRGKTFIEAIECKVLNADALVVLKLVSSRNPDLRDVFMLLPNVEDLHFIKDEVSGKINWNDGMKRASETILSNDFKKNLEGVYGVVNPSTYMKHVNVFKKLVSL